MATVWLTYAWEDNKAQDVDFVAQELVGAGLTVKLDRWNIGAGRRLWEQIEQFIRDPAQSDAWLFYATQASLGSEPCKEEYAYALDRALNTRGGAFPVIGLFPASVDESLIPAGIKTRLYVSLRDPDWKERIKSAAEGRSPSVSRSVVPPFDLKMHRRIGTDGFVIEVRPRAGTWAPFIVGVPAAENDRVKLDVSFGPAGHVPTTFILSGHGQGVTTDGIWYAHRVRMEATPTMSVYIKCEAMPTRLMFGKDGGPAQFTIDPKALFAGHG